MQNAQLIFDLDGTLLDTEALYTEAASIVCARYGATFTLPLKRQVMGGDTRRGAQIVVDALSLPISADQYIAEREHELLRLIPNIEPMPHAQTLLGELTLRQRPWAIATSGHAPITMLKLAQHPWLRDSGPLVCGDDPRIRQAKPAPDIFLVAAAELKAAPARCIVIEDTLNGVRGALRAGMRAVAVLDPRFGFAAQEFTDASIIVSSLAELDLERLDQLL